MNSLDETKYPAKGTLIYDDRKKETLHWCSRYALMHGVAWDTNQLISTGEITLLEASSSVLRQIDLFSVIRSKLVV